MLETIVIAVLISSAVLPAAILWWWHWDRVHIRMYSGVNDDDMATKMFIRVLNAAKTILVIRDDGDKIKGTVYEDDRVIGGSCGGTMRSKYNACSMTRMISRWCGAWVRSSRKVWEASDKRKIREQAGACSGRRFVRRRLLLAAWPLWLPVLSCSVLRSGVVLLFGRCRRFGLVT